MDVLTGCLALIVLKPARRGYLAASPA